MNGGDGGYSFSTQDKLKLYCTENENIDLTLYEETEKINVDHINVLEMINYCFMGNYQKSIIIVDVMNLILIISKYFGAKKLAVKVRNVN